MVIKNQALFENVHFVCLCVHAHLCVYQMCAGNLREQKNKLDP